MLGNITTMFEILLGVPYVKRTKEEQEYFGIGT